MKNLFISFLFSIFLLPSSAQTIFEKCYTYCAGLADEHCSYFDDLVLSSDEKYAYAIITDLDNAAPIQKSILCKIDSLGNTIVSKTKIASRLLFQLSPDTLGFTQTIPFQILRLHDNLFITLSVRDSIITDSSNQVIEAFSWLITSSYDSLLNLVDYNRYFLEVPVTEPFLNYSGCGSPNNKCLQAELVPGSSEFIATVSSSGLNGTQSSILVAHFDTTGNLIKIVSVFLNGWSDLKSKDLVISDEGIIYLLALYDTSGFVMIKMDTSLNLLKSVEYIIAGTTTIPCMLNLLNNTTLTVVAYPLGLQSGVIINIDTSLGVSNGKVLYGDSTYFFSNAFRRGSNGIVLITEKNWTETASNFRQEAVFLDSMFNISQSVVRAKEYRDLNKIISLPTFSTLVPSTTGFWSISNHGVSDVHFGQSSDIFLNRLGPDLEDCILYNLQPFYYLNNVTVLDSVLQLQDSIISFIRDSIVENFQPENVFYILNCSAMVDISNPQKISHGIITLSPNPTTGKLAIRSMQPLKEIELFNLLGKKMDFFENQNAVGKTEIEIEISHLPIGIYILQANDGVNVWRKKVIKQ